MEYIFGVLNVGFMKKIGLLHALLLATLFASAQNWHQIPSGTTSKLNTIDFPSASIGYIGGNDSTLLKTTDGGETWNPVNFSGGDFLSRRRTHCEATICE